MDIEYDLMRKDFEKNGIEKELDSMDILSINSRRKRLRMMIMMQENLPHTQDHEDEFAKSIDQIRRSLSSLKPLGKKQCCVFCKKNKETERMYSTHVAHNEAGDVVCPILQKYRCPNCGATGPKAHTVKYCPHYDGFSPVDYILSTPRNSAGRNRMRSHDAKW